MIEPTREHDFVAHQIVDSTFAVHRALGPGLLESVYEQCLAHELTLREIPVGRQVLAPVIYRDIRLDTGYRMDLVVGAWLSSKSNLPTKFHRFTKHSY